MYEMENKTKINPEMKTGCCDNNLTHSSREVFPQKKTENCKMTKWESVISYSDSVIHLKFLHPALQLSLQ